MAAWEPEIFRPPQPPQPADEASNLTGCRLYRDNPSEAGSPLPHSPQLQERLTT